MKRLLLSLCILVPCFTQAMDDDITLHYVISGLPYNIITKIGNTLADIVQQIKSRHKLQADEDTFSFSGVGDFNTQLSESKDWGDIILCHSVTMIGVRFRFRGGRFVGAVNENSPLSIEFKR